jgi:hypothetical protein
VGWLCIVRSIDIPIVRVGAQPADSAGLFLFDIVCTARYNFDETGNGASSAFIFSPVSPRLTPDADRFLFLEEALDG